MADNERVTCEACNERNATHYLCQPGIGAPKYLCQLCFEAQVPQEALASERDVVNAIRNGNCKYCGAPAVGGCGGSLPLLKNQLELWCEPCRQDLIEFLSKPENAPPEFPFDNEIAQQKVPQQLADYERRQKEFMDRKVSERTRKNIG